jgi:hypothetical protein
MHVQEALRMLGGAGPLSSRPFSIDIPSHSSPSSSSSNSSKNKSSIGAIHSKQFDIDEYQGDFPCLRTETWSSITQALGSAKIPGKYIRKVGEELGYGFRILTSLTASAASSTTSTSTNTSTTAVAQAIGPWLWATSALLNKLGASAVSAGAGGAGGGAGILLLPNVLLHDGRRRR